LRVADALDRSHHQPVQKVRARQSGTEVVLRLVAKVPLDLEMWDVAHEASLFRRVFMRRLRWEVARS
jgi:exopolyphosphatase / guanosine-5'-triphosphate,3'-diphosphate pyrophosphatase